MRPTQFGPSWALDATTTLSIGACFWLLLHVVAMDSGTSFGAFGGLILLIVLAFAEGIGSGAEAPFVEEPWYQHEGSLRGL